MLGFRLKTFKESVPTDLKLMTLGFSLCVDISLPFLLLLDAIKAKPHYRGISFSEYHEFKTIRSAPFKLLNLKTLVLIRLKAFSCNSPVAAPWV
jgi:hypothetical protein